MADEPAWRELAITPDCDAVAAEVTAAHPETSMQHRMVIAMKQTKGSANPRIMWLALERPASLRQGPGK